jgi:hypothetical protein
MSPRDDRQQNLQMELDFSSALTGAARGVAGEETESSAATSGTESPARTNRLMEEVCERENLKQALRQVKVNKGSAGVDRITVGQLTDYLKQHWPVIREQLLKDLRAEASKAGGNPQTGWRGAKAWYPDRVGSLHPASGDAGAAAAVGLDIFRPQLWFSSGTFRPSGSSPSATIHCRRLRLGD